jgi:hypothetical protein
MKHIPTHTAHRNMRKTMIVALARKLLITLWRLVARGEVPEGAVLVCSWLISTFRAWPQHDWNTAQTGPSGTFRPL